MRPRIYAGSEESTYMFHLNSSRRGFSSTTSHSAKLFKWATETGWSDLKAFLRASDVPINGNADVLLHSAHKSVYCQPKPQTNDKKVSLCGWNVQRPVSIQYMQFSISEPCMIMSRPLFCQSSFPTPDPELWYSLTGGRCQRQWFSKQVQTPPSPLYLERLLKLISKTVIMIEVISHICILHLFCPIVSLLYVASCA